VYNFRQAAAAKFERIDLLIDGCYNCAKNHDGPLLVDVIMNFLHDNNLITTGIWFNVTAYKSGRWDTNTYNNWFFIYSMTSRLTNYGMQAGIYSTTQDWNTIIGNNWDTSFNGLMLWYDGNGTKSFSDWPYQEFGQFTDPTIKTIGYDSTCASNSRMLWHP
jgi:hypothetical protein